MVLPTVVVTLITPNSQLAVANASRGETGMTYIVGVVVTLSIQTDTWAIGWKLIVMLPSTGFRVVQIGLN